MSEERITALTERAIDRLEAAVVENRVWYIVLGAILIVLGAISIGAPFATTIAAKVFLGWLFLIAGISQIIHAFIARGWRGFLGHLLVGVLYVVVGAWLAFFPLTGIIGLTVLLAATFVIEGIFKFIMAVQIRPMKGWLWMIISGIIAVAVGILIIFELPSSATWAIGLLVGLNILMSGVAFVLLALSAKAEN